MSGEDTHRLADFGLRGTILPDISESLDGPSWSEYQKIRFEERATAYLENHANRQMGSTAEHKSVEDNIEELADQVSQLVTIYVTSLEGLEEHRYEVVGSLTHDAAGVQRVADFSVE